MLGSLAGCGRAVRHVTVVPSLGSTRRVQPDPHPDDSPREQPKRPQRHRSDAFGAIPEPCVAGESSIGLPDFVCP